MPEIADTAIARPGRQSSFVVVVFIVMQLQGFGSWFCIALPVNYSRYLPVITRQDGSRPW
jgi:hypothetical protein